MHQNFFSTKKALIAKVNQPRGSVATVPDYTLRLHGGDPTHQFEFFPTEITQVRADRSPIPAAGVAYKEEENSKRDRQTVQMFTPTYCALGNQ